MRFMPEKATAARIGVLTFHRCVNYGSYWQARCLVEGLRARGHDAVLLDHRSAQATRAEWRCALSPLLPQTSSSEDRRLYRAKARKFDAAIAALPLSRPFDLAEPETSAPCDVVVVGSDEVWNLRHPWYGGVPAFFGDGLPAKRLVSYAASFGNCEAAQGLPAPWSERLARFASLSVRDGNSHALLRDAIRQPIEIVLDPCLQFPPDIRPKDGVGAVADRIVVYGHGFPDWFKTTVRRSAQRQGCRLLSIGYRNDWADEQHLAAGPEEFAAIMAGARAVGTNFFHGCVFALINAKPFVCAPSPYRLNKVRDLVGLLGIGARLLAGETAPDEVDALLREPAQAQGAEERIDALRGRSSGYLDAALR